MTWLLHTPFTKTLPVGLADSLCLAAARDRQRLHAGVLRHDRAAAGRDAMGRARAAKPGGAHERRAPPRRRAPRALRQDLRRRHQGAGAARRSKSRPVRRSCSSDPRAAARRRRCASSPGSSRPTRAGVSSSTMRDVTALPIEKRNVGMVFQSYALFPNMTCEATSPTGCASAAWRRRARGARRRDAGDDAHRASSRIAHRPAFGRPAPARGAGARARRASRARCCSTSR
jgi:hypothetical protein